MIMKSKQAFKPQIRPSSKSVVPKKTVLYLKTLSKQVLKKMLKLTLF